MIDDFTLRAGAVVVAALVVAGPWLVAYAKKTYSALRKDSPKAQESATRDDAHTVVEIARRLSKAGNVQGTELCKKLLDVMLTSEAKA